MTETIKLPNYCELDWENARYGSLEELKEMLLHKRIVKWDKDFLLALAECEADDGNGGYYYSVGSLVVGEIHFPVVRA